MKLNLNNISLLILSSLYIIFCTGCTKDADLLSEFVIQKSDTSINLQNLVVNDFFYVNLDNSSILDVLENDQFTNPTNVSITGTTDPENGTVVINEDNTLTYIPNTGANETGTSSETTTDTFVYTAEETQADGSTTAEEGTVVVNSEENKAPTTGENVFYVTVNGKSSNNGKTESSAWDIIHAFKTAKAGDIVHIKAGNYGNKNLKGSNSGTLENPIKFIGYTNEPNDINAMNGSTFVYIEGKEPNSATMPLLKGTRINNEGKGTAILLDKNFINISNFQIMYYSKGISAIGDNQILNNIVVFEVGDFNPNHTDSWTVDRSKNNYDGEGIEIFGNNSKLINSIVINAGAESIKISGGENQNHKYNQVYSDNNVNSCDYYYLINKGGKQNSINNISIYRKKGMSHKGHGLICKDDASYNTFENIEVINTIIEMSFAGVHDNLVKNSSITGQYSAGGRGGGILVANGANNNTFENISIDNVKHMISFADWNDGYQSEYDQTNAGNNNLFSKITGSKALNVIYFDAFDNLGGIAHDNVIIDSQFSNAERLFQVNRGNSDNALINCTLKDIKALSISSEGYNFTLNPNTVFENCKGINLGFTLPN